MIRLFTAIELPQSARARLQLLQGGVPGARWIPGENLHLTLRFIGEVSDAVARDIDDMLSGIRARPFQLALKGVGEFGRKEGRSLWAGVAQSEALHHLAAKIESALQRMGLPAETRKYTPHVTLARLRDTPIGKVGEYLADHALFETEPYDIDRFALFSSRQSSNGSLYRLESDYVLLA